MIRWRPNLPIIAFSIPFVFMGSAFAGKNKFDVNFGYFSVSAKTANSSGSVAGIGLYHFNYRRTLTPKMELTLGYTLYFTGIVAGDSGSGLDVGGNYFPFSRAAEVSAGQGGRALRLEEQFRPYLGITFNQRSYQSVQSSYSGFGLHGGFEYSLKDNLSLNTAVRMIILSSARSSSATEMGGFGGLSFRF